ncbi:hypothetical protein AXG93_4905s1290 [Marchantia polymorpha subsp. ruderalis]|uniref:Uncharacterized protein n=1 Tax=Marchantia polymorpha subsp. ruderalis TaxID=1480154 RepID=A0A176VHL7_MARPO|nr:hypothetical protein AXG93_4905s1290 [Marchantia polymorpha subsp. ruderalis]
MERVTNGLAEWSLLYLKYLQVYTKLEDCYDQFMVILNEGGEYYDFSDYLVNRKLSFEVLNVIPPRFLTDDNKALLESREKFLIAALTKHGLMNVPEPAKPPSVLTLDEAAILIQTKLTIGVCKVAKDYRAMQEVELARQKAGVESHTRESACLVIQRVYPCDRLRSASEYVDFAFKLLTMHSTLEPVPPYADRADAQRR